MDNDWYSPEQVKRKIERYSTENTRLHLENTELREELDTLAVKIMMLFNELGEKFIKLLK